MDLGREKCRIGAVSLRQFKVQCSRVQSDLPPRQTESPFQPFQSFHHLTPFKPFQPFNRFTPFKTFKRNSAGLDITIMTIYHLPPLDDPRESILIPLFPAPGARLRARPAIRTISWTNAVNRGSMNASHTKSSGIATSRRTCAPITQWKRAHGPSPRPAPARAGRSTGKRPGPARAQWYSFRRGPDLSDNPGGAAVPRAGKSPQGLRALR
jgi:hypothetical protein